MTRVLIVTETGDAWPSAFVRAAIYADHFRRDGIEAVYASRCAPRLTKLIERAPGSVHRLLGIALDRVLPAAQRLSTRSRESRILGLSPGFDVIYLQKVASEEFIRRLRARTRARLVYDLNDGLWLPSRAVFAQGRIREILQGVDAVTCDNPHGQAYARALNRSSHLVPDPAQVEAFDARRASIAASEDPIVIGWIGSRGTAFNLFLVWEALERIFSTHANVTLRIVGTGSDRSALPPFEKVRYSVLPSYTQAGMIDEVLKMQIGLFPMFDVEDSLSRGFLKGEIYWSGQAALIASPVGQCNELVRDGGNGMIARNPREWEERLGALIRDRELRQRIARAGLDSAREHFSLDRCYLALKAALFPGSGTASDPPNRA